MPDATPATAGPVALVGSGEFTAGMVAVDRLLLDGRPPRAVFLPTAAGQEGDDRVDEWIELGCRHYREMGVEPVALRVVDRTTADDPDLASRVDGAGLVYLSGGNPCYLAGTLAGTRVWDAIVAAWNAGAALAGCSAGACALSAVTFDANGTMTRHPGLAVVPAVVVLPHFDRIESWWPGVVERFLERLEPGQTLVGIDEGTALVGGRDRFTVHGAGAAWVVEADGRHPHAAGEEIGFGLPGPSDRTASPGRPAPGARR